MVKNPATLFVQLLVDSQYGGLERILASNFVSGSNFVGEEELAVYLVANFSREAQDWRGFQTFLILYLL